MKTLLLGFTITVLVLSTTLAQAKSALVPSYKGKIHNHTSIATDKLIVRVELDCEYSSGFVWPESKGCGNEVLHIPVNADGTYVVPDMKWQKKKSIKNYSFSFSVSASELYPEGMTFALFDEKEILTAPKKLAEVSIYEMSELNINAITPTGEPYATWRGMIDHPSETVKDACVELIFNIRLNREDEYASTTFRSSEVKWDKEVAGVIPRMFLAAAGNTGANMLVKGSLYYKTSKPECKPNQSKVMFDNEVSKVAPMSELYRTFNNSSYKLD